jgi:hypothetical protein
MTDERGNVFVPEGKAGEVLRQIILRDVEAMEQWGRCNPNVSDITRIRLGMRILAEKEYVLRGLTHAGMEGLRKLRRIPFSDTPPNCEGITSPSTYGATREKFIQETIAPLTAKERQEVLDGLASVEPGRKSGKAVTLDSVILSDLALERDLAGYSSKQTTDELCNADEGGCKEKTHPADKPVGNRYERMRQRDNKRKHSHVERMRQRQNKLLHYMTSELELPLYCPWPRIAPPEQD